MAALYDIRNLRRVFGEREVLNIPELTLEEGTIYGLLGPNGAGKTTLMRLLSFMDNPTEGEIVFQGEKVRPEHAARYRARVVWVPQSPVLFTGSLLYNIEYPMRLKGIRRSERRERAVELLDTVNLRHLAEAPARRLSGGEAQRASIARALAAGAKVLLFDEPTASVDFRSRGEIIRLIRELRQTRGLSIIVTTHDLELAAELCREQITLFDGRIVSRYALPEDGGGLPRAVSAIPGALRNVDGTITVFARLDDVPALSVGVLPQGAEQGGTAEVRGLSESAAGITLRISPAPGRHLDVLLTGEAEMSLARTLTLERTVKVVQ